ncbi:MAG TPA: response regulator [Candidatus Dormibacteraeota bacterium]|nr:response regulator [Candidatus Dormibacteraeota bacterium]
MQGGQRPSGGGLPSGALNARVLIVDDDPGYQRLLDIRLRQSGATTALAGTGEEGLELLESFAPQLVIADLRMPGIDGLELCRRIRADPAHKRLPILILTSAEHSSEIGEVVGLGLIWYMRKGAEWTTILRSLHNLLAHAEDLRAAV